MNESLVTKMQKLEREYFKCGKVAVAFSSGVDSTLLLATAVNSLGKDNVIAITAKSPAFPVRETEEALSCCEVLGVKHIIIETNELDNEEYAKNPPDRCYICKKEIFSQIKKVAEEHGFEHVAEGSNVDDMSDYRPGMKAIEELDILSPLKAAMLTKDEIRDISKELELSTWEKQSFACLASRFAYGERITAEKLLMIDSAEQLLMDLGFDFFRVRIHGENNYTARIEIEQRCFEQIIKPEIREKICDMFRKIGFSYVTIDLEGYRTGSMNEVLDR